MRKLRFCHKNIDAHKIIWYLRQYRHYRWRQRLTFRGRGSCYRRSRFISVRSIGRGITKCTANIFQQCLQHFRESAQMISVSYTHARNQLQHALNGNPISKTSCPSTFRQTRTTAHGQQPEFVTETEKAAHIPALPFDVIVRKVVFIMGACCSQ